MAEIVNAPETLAPDGRLFRDKVAAEIFNLRVRRDAKRTVEQEEREMAAAAVTGEMPMVYDPLPQELPELIPGLLPESGTAAIVGETETGKTCVSLEICSSLLTGEPLWGAIRPNRTISKVVYVLGEHTVETVQGLYHRMQLPHAGEFRVIGPEQLHPYKAMVIGGVQQPLAVERMIKWTEGAGLVVFDPIAGFVQGTNAENDNVAMRTLIDTLSLVAQRNNAACLVLAHTGKPTISQDGNEVRRTTYATRGASGQEDAMTHVFYLRRAIQVKQQQDPGERYDIILRKFKGRPTSDVMRLMRDPETKRNTLINAKPVRGAYPGREEMEEYRRRIQRMLESNPQMEWDTIVKLIADGDGLPVETLKRWLTGA